MVLHHEMGLKLCLENKVNAHVEWMIHRIHDIFGNFDFGIAIVVVSVLANHHVVLIGVLVLDLEDCSEVAFSDLFLNLEVF